MYYNLKKLRTLLNVSITEMARDLNFDRGNLHKIDNKKRKMTLELLVIIGEKYKLHPTILWEYIDK
jgi:plasmid maintenance system antidote protein VapI